MTNPDDTGSSAATAAVAPGTHNENRAPGEWPPCPYTDALLTRMRWERARRAITVGAIRAVLEEQPNAWCIRACARRWCADITAMAEDVASAVNRTEDDT